MISSVCTEISGSVYPEKIEETIHLDEIRSIIAQYPPSGEAYSLQINGQYKSTKLDPKPGSKANGGGNTEFGYNGAYWHTLTDASLAAIAEFVRRGFILRFGIKLGGTRYRENFVSCDFIYLDVDSGGRVETSISTFSSQAYLVYGTPSYTPANQKHRIILRLSRSVLTTYEIKAIYKYFIEKHNFIDPSCKDPARIMYSTINPENIFYRDDNKFLDLSSIERDPDYQRQLSLVRNEDLISRQKINSTPHPVYQKLIHLLTEKYQYDLNKFFRDLDIGYDFRFTQIDTDDPEVELKWVGYNPFSQTNRSGTSLVCSLRDRKLLFYNRAASSDPDSKHGGGLLDFYKSMILQESDIYPIAKEEFYAILQEMCAKLGLRQYTIEDLYFLDDKGNKKKKDLSVILHEYIHPELAGMIYRVPNVQNNVQSDFDFYLAYAHDHWRIGGSKMICSMIELTFQSMFGVPMSSSWHSALIKGGYEDFPPAARLNDRPPPNLEYYYFSNGMYCYKSRQLIPYNFSVWNFQKQKIPYIPCNGVGIKALKEALDYSLVSEEDQQIILYAFILTVRQKFFNAHKFLYLYGRKGSGKSTVASLFARAFGLDVQSAGQINRDPSVLGKYLHQVTVFDEVTSLGNVMDTLATIVRATQPDKGNIYYYNDKYVIGHTVYKPLTLIFTGESLNPGTTKGVEGVGDRMLTAEFNRGSVGYNTPWRKFHEDSVYLHDLISWACEYSEYTDEEMLAWLKFQMTNPESNQFRRSREMLSTADPVTSFLELFRDDPATKYDKDMPRDRKTSIGYDSGNLRTLYEKVTFTKNLTINAWNGISQRISSHFKTFPSASKEKVLGRGYVWFGIKFISVYDEEESLTPG